MHRNHLLTTTACLALTLFACAARAEVKLPSVLSDHAVLQRNQPIHIWGWANPGEQVEVTLQNDTQSTTADVIGKWGVYLKPQPAGGPYQLIVQATNTLTLSDILIGDVWVASGQSNMEMPLKGWDGAPLKNSAEEIARADHPKIHLLRLQKNSSPFPLRDQPDVWTACTPATAPEFSAAAYFFGREILERENVPIGLIDSTWGGTPAEAWTSAETLTADAGFMPVFQQYARLVGPHADEPRIIELEKRQDQEAKQASRPAPQHPWHPDLTSFLPGGLYNAMIAPLTPYGIKGAIWYQGESNSGPDRGPLYHHVFSSLISDWRAHWHQGDFPFYFVQISSYDSKGEGWGIVRDAQRRTLSLVHTGMAVTLDIGDPNNVHPADKQSVGHRLALAARALTYNEKIEYSGPLFRQATIENTTVRVAFDHTTGGLAAKGGPLNSFELAGEDRKFLPATATIEGETVLVTSPQIKAPKYVRYAWANVPDANLFNGEGLPASTFTSEEPSLQLPPEP